MSSVRGDRRDGPRSGVAARPPLGGRALVAALREARRQHRFLRATDALAGRDRPRLMSANAALRALSRSAKRLSSEEALSGAGAVRVVYDAGLGACGSESDLADLALAAGVSAPTGPRFDAENCRVGGSERRALAVYARGPVAELDAEADDGADGAAAIEPPDRAGAPRIRVGSMSASQLRDAAEARIADFSSFVSALPRVARAPRSTDAAPDA